MPAVKFAPKTTQIGRNKVFAPDYDGQAVTPDDNNDLPNGVAVGLVATATGNVSVNLHDGTAVTLTGLVAGTLYPIAVARIKATSTTATGLFALYPSAF